MMWKWAACMACLAVPYSLLALRNPADPKPEALPMIYCTLGKPANIYALAFSPDDKHLLAAAQRDGNNHPNYEMMEWDLETRKVSRKFDAGHGGQVVSITYSKSGQFLAIGHFNGFVSVRDNKGDVVLSFKSLEGELGNHLKSVSISEDKDAFVHTVVQSGIVQSRSIPGGQTRIYPVQSAYSAAAMTRDGKTLLCCTPKFLKVYEDGDFSSGRYIESFNCFKDPGTFELAVSDDSSTAMAAEYRGGELALFDLKKDKLIKKWKGPADQPIYTIIAFHDRNWFATGNDTGEIKVWDEKGELRATLKEKGRDEPVAALALTRDNRFLASSGQGRPIVIWDLRAILGEK